MTNAFLKGSLAIAAFATMMGGSAIEGVRAASMPDTENGRYTFSPVTDGLMRLDTKTGAVSTCTNSNSGWACYAVPDERAALDAEIGRLQSDNEKLKSQLAARDVPAGSKADQPSSSTDPLKKFEPRITENPRKIEIPLPSDSDIDRVAAFVGRAWRRLIDMAGQMQRDVAGKI